MHKNRLLFISFVLATTFVMLTNCSGNPKNNVWNVDELLTNAGSLVDETVIVEGLCTHVCSKSGMKLFLQSTDASKTIRAESGATLGKFDPASVDKKVRVRGKLMEQATENSALHIHGEEGEVCETEEVAEQTFYIDALSYQIID